MPPHGGGMLGSTHSHDAEFPDDDWNLYSQLVPEETTALNVTQPSDTLGIFKPHARRLSPEPLIVSDADEEIIVLATFVSPVNIRKIMVIGGGADDSQHPRELKCYVNQTGVDFTSIAAMRPAQEFNLPVNNEGAVELITSIHPFTTVNTIAFYFPSNYGDESTVIRYIGLQGEHTHYQRRAVDTVYEVLCTGEDIEHPKDEAIGGHHLH